MKWPVLRVTGTSTLALLSCNPQGVIPYHPILLLLTHHQTNTTHLLSNIRGNSSQRERTLVRPSSVRRVTSVSLTLSPCRPFLPPGLPLCPRRVSPPVPPRHRLTRVDLPFLSRPTCSKNPRAQSRCPSLNDRVPSFLPTGPREARSISGHLPRETDTGGVWVGRSADP